MGDLEDPRVKTDRMGELVLKECCASGRRKSLSACAGTLRARTRRCVIRMSGPTCPLRAIKSARTVAFFPTDL